MAATTVGLTSEAASQHLEVGLNAKDWTVSCNFVKMLHVLVKLLEMFGLSGDQLRSARMLCMFCIVGAGFVYDNIKIELLSWSLYGNFW